MGCINALQNVETDENLVHTINDLKHYDEKRKNYKLPLGVVNKFKFILITGMKKKRKNILSSMKILRNSKRLNTPVNGNSGLHLKDYIITKLDTEKTTEEDTNML